MCGGREVGRERFTNFRASANARMELRGTSGGGSPARAPPSGTVSLDSIKGSREQNRDGREKKKFVKQSEKNSFLGRGT